MNTDFAVEELSIEGVKRITPFYREDNRGYFLKSLEKEVYQEWGLETEIYEDFESYSKKGVLRGLHFQVREPQVKIVRVLRGSVHDVVVDLRQNSKTFGRYIDVILSDENHSSLWIPRGFAHGFEVLSEEAVMSYKCIGRYLEGFDSGIRWNDSTLGILWKTKEPAISDRDAALMTFCEFVEHYKGL